MGSLRFTDTLDDHTDEQDCDVHRDADEAMLLLSDNLRSSPRMRRDDGGSRWCRSIVGVVVVLALLGFARRRSSAAVGQTRPSELLSPPAATWKRKTPARNTLVRSNFTVIDAAALKGCKVCATAPPLPNVSLGWWTPAIGEAEAKLKAAVAAAEAAAKAAAAAAVRDAVAMNTSLVMKQGRIEVGRRVRMRWADGLHLGTVAKHETEVEALGGKPALLHCIAYDTGFRACHNLEQMSKECAAAH